MANGNLKVASRSGKKLEEVEINVSDIFRAGIMKEELRGIIDDFTSKLFLQAKEIRQQLLSDDGDKILTGLI
jgi:hypothetical protein